MNKIINVVLIFLSSFHLLLAQVPEGFVDLEEVIPQLIIDPKYYSADNFLGRPVEGYLTPKMYLTGEAAESLRDVQLELLEKGFSLKIFDAYRPQMAVDDFMDWSKDTLDKSTKSIYYPNVPKSRLFGEGYIAERSSHSRGSTVDVTIVDLSTGKELDMGTPFDYFGLESWPESKEVTNQQRRNRKLLSDVMQKHNFSPLQTEWWHFTLRGEPFPKKYYNFFVR